MTHAFLTLCLAWIPLVADAGPYGASVEEKVEALELLLRDTKNPDERQKVGIELIGQYALVYSNPQSSPREIKTYRQKTKDLVAELIKGPRLSKVDRATLVHKLAHAHLNDEPEKALSLFRDALKIAPNYPESSAALFALADDAFEKENYRLAQDLYRQLLPRKELPSDYIQLKYAVVALKNTDFKAAERAFLAVLAKPRSEHTPPALEGLVIATSFTKSESALLLLASQEFGSKRALHIEFLTNALKQRIPTRSRTERELFSGLLRLIPSPENAGRALAVALEASKNSPPPVFAGYLREFAETRCGVKKTCTLDDVGVVANLEPLAKPIYTAIERAYRQWTTKDSAESRRTLDYLTHFYLTVLSGADDTGAVVSARTNLCRKIRDYECLKWLSSDRSLVKHTPEKLRLSLRLEAALKNRSISSLKDIKDRDLLLDAAEKLKGDPLWRQIMPTLIVQELERGDKVRAAKWSAELIGAFPTDKDAKQVRALALLQNDDLAGLKRAHLFDEPLVQTLVAASLPARLKSYFEDNDRAKLGEALRLATSLFPEAQTRFATISGTTAHQYAIATGHWTECARLPVARGPLPLEAAICRLVQDPNYNPLARGETLKEQDVRYLMEALSLLAPSRLIDLVTKSRPTLKKEAQTTLFFAHQNQQGTLFPVLTEAEFRTVRNVAPSILAPAEANELETRVKALSMPTQDSGPDAYLKKLIVLRQESASLRTSTEIQLRRASGKSKMRTLQVLARFEAALATALRQCPVPAHMTAQQKSDLKREMRSIASEHQSLADQYSRRFTEEKAAMNQAVSTASPGTFEMTSPQTWIWPDARPASLIRQAVRERKHLQAFFMTDFNRSLNKFSEREFSHIRTLILASSSRAVPMRLRIRQELEQAHQLDILNTANLLK